VLNVQQIPSVSEQPNVKHMEQTSSSLSANSAAALPNGSVGVILISANLVTRGNVLEITCHGRNQVNYRNVLE